MARMLRVTVHGLKELDEALAELPQATARNVLRRALAQAAQPVVLAAAAQAPRRTGRLAQSLEARPALSRRQRRRRVRAGDVELFVGATWPSGAHAHLQEFGTRFHAARPFLGPAWESHKVAVLHSIAGFLRAEITKAAQRLARKAAKVLAHRGSP